MIHDLGAELTFLACIAIVIPTKTHAEATPVIIGIGEITDRPDDPANSLEPMALMAEALQRAAQDANCGVQQLDSIDIVHQVSWRYEKTAARLCERLNMQPARAVYGVTGGESPMRYLHEAALRIARGESEVAAIVGAEAQYAVNKAKAANIELPWTPIAKDVENPFPIEGRLNPVAIAHGAIRPIHVYPFYENASHHAWQQTPRQALAESGAVWARYSQVAETNPYSWSRKSFTAAQVITPTPHNRLIAYPYTKHMVANPAVNQGAAIILTTLARARAMNIDEGKLIYVLGGASAMEPRDYLTRDQYVRSDAQDLVLNGMRSLANENRTDLQALELYSCFPCVPKMTRRVLRLREDLTPTVTGGLSFFGAPLNNYMTHAVCAMVRHLRDDKASTGMLYGQGEFVTKHHAVLLSRNAPIVALKPNYSLQTELDRRRGIAPALVNDYTGDATIETHTVIYDRNGAALNGVVIAKTNRGQRVMARVPGHESDAIARLIDPDQAPIGARGRISKGDGLLLFQF